MQYTDYTEQTTFNKRGKPATVRIDGKAQGRIYFSNQAVAILGLRAGDRIAFRTYDHDKGVIYFYPQATGFTLSAGSSGLSIYSRPLANKLLEALGFVKDQHKTIGVKNECVLMPGTKCQAWMLVKEDIHKPIKWRKNPC